jgi:hypothetical protein
MFFPFSKEIQVSILKNVIVSLLLEFNIKGA